MSDDDLIRRIDLALRAQPLPPERLLQRIIQELQRARGGEQGDYYGDDGSYFEDDISFSNGSSRGSSRGGSSRGGSSQFSYDSMASRCVSGPLITPGTPSTIRGPPSHGSRSRAMMSSTGSIRPEHTSLPMRDHGNLLKDKYAAQYEMRKVRTRVGNRGRYGPASQNISADGRGTGRGWPRLVEAGRGTGRGWPRLAEAGGRPELDLALVGRISWRVHRPRPLDGDCFPHRWSHPRS